MLRLQSAVISLLLPLVIAGCAASTPIPEPAPTALVPTMRPTAVPTAMRGQQLRLPGPRARPLRRLTTITGLLRRLRPRYIPAPT